MLNPVVFQKGYYETNEYVPQHITVDVGGKALGRAGAMLSSRMVLTVQDEAENQIKGFFTENEYINAGSIFATRNRAMRDDPKYKDFRPIFDAITKNVSTRQQINVMIKAYGGGANPTSEKIKRIAKAMKSGKIKDESKRGLRSQVLRWLQEVCMIPKEKVEEMSQKELFWPYLGETLSKMAVDVFDLVSTHVSDAGHAQTFGSNVNKRNNAMYDYAKLLGEPELLARSSSMTLKNGDEEIHGTFMVNAKGESRNNIYAIAQKDRRSLELTGTALREISKLQIIDYLCGNIDRHQDNMFYQYERTNDGKLRITGVQGIDNDASFGTVNHEQQFVQYMSGLEDITIIDGDLAREILSVDPTAIEERMRLAELSAPEIAAAHKRLADLKKQLNDGKIKIISGQEAWDEKIRDDPKLDNLKSETIREANIFQIIEDALHFYEKYKDKKNFDFSAPEGPLVGATEITESGGLDNQFRIFSKMRKKLGSIQSPEIGDVKRKLDIVVDTLADILQHSENKDFLGDKERNVLSEELKELADAADLFAQKRADDINSKDKNVRAGLHNVKNLAAFTRFSRESVQRDAMEKEMNAASYQAYQLAQKHGIQTLTALSDDAALAPLEHTYDDLKKGFSSVDSFFIPSSREFKDMMTAFNALKDAPDKRATLKEISEQAQRYLDFKTKPDKNGVLPQLSDYAKKRVEYARKILNFATKASERLDYQKEAREIVQFSNRCAELTNNYIYAKHIKDGGEKLEQAENAIFGAGEFFREGIQKIEAASRKYATDHEMQVLCHSLMTDLPGHTSSIQSLAVTHADLINEKNGALDKNDQNAVKPFEAFSVDSETISGLMKRLEKASAVKQAANEVPNAVQNQSQPPIRNKAPSVLRD